MERPGFDTGGEKMQVVARIGNRARPSLGTILPLLSGTLSGAAFGTFV